MGEFILRHSDEHSILTLSLVPGVGPKSLFQLVDYFQSASSALDASQDQLQKVAGIGPKLAKEISLARKTVHTDAVIEHCRSNDIQILTIASDQYPVGLKEIHNPPVVLYLKGAIREMDSMAVSIVGSRHATPYGKRTAENLARGLVAAGYCVVSGMARGIDAAAHTGALNADGRTLAVLGSGVLNIYPAEHKELSEAIIRSGAILSEVPPHHPPKSGAFPQRNRIVTGLSLGTVVVEAAYRSGALISARLAGEQGREVFAVPGAVDSRMSRGCHRLIRDGAKLVETVDDILEELGPLSTPISRSNGESIQFPAELKLNEQEKCIFQAIGTSATEIDLIAEQTGIPVHRVLSTVSVLEVRRLIKRVSGSSIARI